MSRTQLKLVSTRELRDGTRASQPSSSNSNVRFSYKRLEVQKVGSVGRSIDVTTYKNYEELISAIECIFGLEGLLTDTRGS
ncbi:hypothetical protein RIF29_16274 [Crotalaria pallida]|uniref:Auxin-responsive protein n=1 Tax=Crotalaria pallida TaxID=3830 RepID=A0AAN9FG64_CROPI